MSGVKHCPNLLERGTKEKNSTGMRLLTFLHPLHASCSPSCCTGKLWFMTSAWIIAFFNNKAKGMKEHRSTKSPLKTAENERKQIMYVYVGVGKKVSHFRFVFLVFVVSEPGEPCWCLLKISINTTVRATVYASLYPQVCPCLSFYRGKGDFLGHLESKGNKGLAFRDPR